MPSKSLTAGSIWKTLAKINVNEFTEEKVGLTYLSWSHAYRIMMENYPEMQIKWNGTTDESGVIRDVTYYEGGTAMVSCTVTIGDVVKEMWLPVMDYRMKSIAHPASRDISDAKMRCLTKCFSLFGLFNYGYSGDGLPREEAGAEVVKPKAKPKRKRAKKAKAPEEPEVNGATISPSPIDPAHIVAPDDEVVVALTDACNEAAKAGWLPDAKLQAEIKKAVKSKNIKVIVKLLNTVNELSNVATKLHDEREEQGELIDA